MPPAEPAGIDALAEDLVRRLDGRIVLGLPLGLGKPNRLTNALYRRAKSDAEIDLEIVTALSLDPPTAAHWLEARLMDPVVERLFGADYPRLEYLADLRAGEVPANVRVTEFYFASGAALGVADMQRRYISSNYTHVARDLVDRGINVVCQLVAGPDEHGRYSLSCNPDISLDLQRRLASHPDRSAILVGQVHPDLPFMHGDAVVDAEFFDYIVTEEPRQRLFPVPRLPVSLQDHAVGFHASRLVADGGTLQIGIGSLSDALVHALILRHADNPVYRSVVAAQDHPAPPGIGGEDVLDEGLYGASEMFMDGFMHLYNAGVLTREVFDDPDLMDRANAGERLDQSGTGALMDGGFFLGSTDFYQFLQKLSETERPRFRMHGVGRINQLYGGNETLEIAQRRRARFVNTTMMVTATGAAVSDALADHQVVSGVGGQYNFVAMAHAMDDGRSILMLRAVRESGGQRTSNIVWEYPHATIPRHLRDLVVTEYGIADLRGRTDEECIQALVMIMDAAFQDELVEKAQSAGKLDRAWHIPDRARQNTPRALAERFRSHRERFPGYPFGSDFTDIEQRLIPALKQFKELSKSRLALIRALIRGRPGDFPEELARLGLDRPGSIKERAYARLVAAVLAE